jgi:SAM-dependent methyltransferase
LVNRVAAPPRLGEQRRGFGWVRTAQDFDRYYKTADPWEISKYRFRNRALRRLIGSYLFGRAVLELGCGEGHLSQAVFGDACTVTGVDISSVAISRAAPCDLSNARFQVADFLDIPFSGYDVITAIECLYYLSPAEQDVVLDKVATEHRGKSFVLCVPIIGGKCPTHPGVMRAFARHGMALVKSHNLTIRNDSLRGRTLAIALKFAPLGHMLLDRVPDEFVYQRCYVTS